jgi:hypothetical protein
MALRQLHHTVGESGMLVGDIAASKHVKRERPALA